MKRRNILYRSCVLAAIALIVFPVNYMCQVNLTTSNLPIITIDTHGQIIRDDPKITANMKVFYKGEGETNSTLEAPHYDGYIGIEIRGSSAQNFPKKSYTVETRDSLGNNLDFSLLDLPAENDWVLYAPYSDKSLLRNVLAYKLYSDMGHYSPRTKFCEVILNGVYAGVYVLCEKIKRDENRVDISRLRDEDTSGAQLTGGYILQIDRHDGSGWTSTFPPFEGASQRVYYQIVYPDDDDINNAQYSYIRLYITDFEQAMERDSYDNIYSGFIQQLDVNSLVDYIIINELSKNVDAYRLSTYLYKDRDDRDGRIHIGPVWDYNLAFGNADYYRGQFNDGWHLNLDNPDNYQPPFWIGKLWNNRLVFNKICARWDELRSSILSDSYINDFINSSIESIGEGVDRNFKRWNILGTKVWPNPLVHYSFGSEIEYLKKWVRERAEWIDDHIDNNYSRVNWNTEELVYTDKPEFSRSKNDFFSGLKNIDNVKFIPVTDKIYITESSDSINIVVEAGEYQSFIGMGYFKGELVEVSPLYTVTASVTSVYEEGNSPSEYILKQNYPNPFNPTTTIEYQIPYDVRDAKFASPTNVELVVYDILGREVATLVDSEQRPGTYKVQFNAGDLTSGIYYYSLKSGFYHATAKMLLLK